MWPSMCAMTWPSSPRATLSSQLVRVLLEAQLVSVSCYAGCQAKLLASEAHAMCSLQHYKGSSRCTCLNTHEPYADCYVQQEQCIGTSHDRLICIATADRVYPALLQRTPPLCPPTSRTSSSSSLPVRSAIIAASMRPCTSLPLRRSTCWSRTAHGTHCPL